MLLHLLVNLIELNVSLSKAIVVEVSYSLLPSFFEYSHKSYLGEHVKKTILQGLSKINSVKLVIYCSKKPLV